MLQAEVTYITPSTTSGVASAPAVGLELVRPGETEPASTLSVSMASSGLKRCSP